METVLFIGFATMKCISENGMEDYLTAWVFILVKIDTKVISLMV